MNTDESSPLYFDAILLLARSCAEMRDFTTSIKLIKPILSKLPKKSRVSIIQELGYWLLGDIVSQQYVPLNDEKYLLALEIHLELISIAKTPDDILENLRDLSRWLELLGADEMTQWIKSLIRIEAPGTLYVDRHDRGIHTHNIDLSSHMKSYLVDFEKRMRPQASTKIKQLLKSVHSLGDVNFQLDD